jgi:transcription elongation factor Elf1
LVDLSAPVDVYADWVDACDAVAKEAAAANTASQRPANRGSRSRVDEDVDDFIVQDDGDAEGDFDDDN